MVFIHFICKRRGGGGPKKAVERESEEKKNAVQLTVKRVTAKKDIGCIIKEQMDPVNYRETKTVEK